MEQPPTIPPQAAAKKGMPALAWVGIGCGGIILLAIIGSVFAFMKFRGVMDKFAANPEKAAAEMIVSMSPELEMLSQNEDKGTMTIRLKDGQEVTLSYKDIAEGRITATDANGVTTSIGSTDLSQVPAWVPRADDLSDAVIFFHSDNGGQVTGQFSGKSAKGLEDLKTFFETAAVDLGLTSSSNSSMDIGAASVATLDFSGGGKILKVVITAKSGTPTLINTHYTGH